MDAATYRRPALDESPIVTNQPTSRFATPLAPEQGGPPLARLAIQEIHQPQLLLARFELDIDDFTFRRNVVDVADWVHWSQVGYPQTRSSTVRRGAKRHRFLWDSSFHLAPGETHPGTLRPMGNLALTLLS